MLVRLNYSYYDKVIDYIKKEPEYNLFSICDLEKYGCSQNFFKAWVDISDNGNIEAVLFKYFETLIFYGEDEYESEEFLNLVRLLEYSDISGKSKALDNFVKNLEFKKHEKVKFCKLQSLNTSFLDKNIHKVKKMKWTNIKKISQLYTNIEEFENTSTQNIKNILKSGRGYYIEEDRKAVAMAKSTSESNKYAMIVGVGTHPKYRGKGYATECLIKICEQLLKEEKMPCLMYNDESAGKIYQKLGFEYVGDWSIYKK